MRPDVGRRWTAMLSRRLTLKTAALAGPATHVPGLFYLIALNVIVAHNVSVARGTAGGRHLQRRLVRAADPRARDLLPAPRLGTSGRGVGRGVGPAPLTHDPVDGLVRGRRRARRARRAHAVSSVSRPSLASDAHSGSCSPSSSRKSSLWSGSWWNSSTRSARARRPNVERVRERRVAPAEVVGVLVVGVLAVVDQQRRVARKLEARDPVLLQLVERGAQPRLVVGDVTERAAVGLDPVSERRPAVRRPTRPGSRPTRSATRSSRPRGTTGGRAARAPRAASAARRCSARSGPPATPPATPAPRSRPRTAGWNIGAKNISPWMWSRCRWVSRMCSGRSLGAAPARGRESRSRRRARARCRPRA